MLLFENGFQLVKHLSDGQLAALGPSQLPQEPRGWQPMPEGYREPEQARAKQWEQLQIPLLGRLAQLLREPRRLQVEA